MCHKKKYGQMTFEAAKEIEDKIISDSHFSRSSQMSTSMAPKDLE